MPQGEFAKPRRVLQCLQLHTKARVPLAGVWDPMLKVLAVAASSTFLCLLAMRSAAKRTTIVQSKAAKCVLTSVVCVASLSILKGVRRRSRQHRQATADTIRLEDKCMQCSAGEVSVVTWNVLAPCFASRKRYSYVKPHILSWEDYRLARLRTIIKQVRTAAQVHQRYHYAA